MPVTSSSELGPRCGATHLYRHDVGDHNAHGVGDGKLAEQIRQQPKPVFHTTKKGEGEAALRSGEDRFVSGYRTGIGDWIGEPRS